MIKVFHIDYDRNPEIARRDIRSPMTEEMAVYYRSVSGINYADRTKEQNDRGNDMLDLADAERKRLVIELFNAGGYVEVAHVETDDLEYAYKATQNGVLSDSWSQEPPNRVKAMGQTYHLHNGKRYGYKSSDIGDVMVTDDGKRHMVDTFGFEEI